jgi:hypothetical protein
VREIPLTRGQVAIVDDVDYEELSKFDWHINNYGYAVRHSSMKNGKRHPILMHRIIWEMHNGPITEGEIDHINGNGADNRLENLRLCTDSQNQANMHKKVPHSSKFKGVRLHRDGKFEARIRLNHQLIYIGLFDSEVEAARAYDAKARELFGEFAKTNFP